jgi:hypothetical protein
MVIIKLQNSEGKIKYIKKEWEGIVNIGDTINFKWNKEWKVIKILNPERKKQQ